MDTIRKISLDLNWKCAYFHGEPIEGNVFTPTLVDSLSAWSWDAPTDPDFVAHLFHHFFLEPTDFCVSYTLRLESAPKRLRITVNTEELGEFDGTQPLAIDVTDAVRLEDNVIRFKVGCAEYAPFGAVYLEQIPCE